MHLNNLNNKFQPPPPPKKKKRKRKKKSKRKKRGKKHIMQEIYLGCGSRNLLSEIVEMKQENIFVISRKFSALDE